MPPCRPWRPLGDSCSGTSATERPGPPGRAGPDHVGAASVPGRHRNGVGLPVDRAWPYALAPVRRRPRAAEHPGTVRDAVKRETTVRTHSTKASEIERTWYVVDAEGLTLGRMATEVARLLRGKHKTTFSPHLDTGDHVIIVNADKVVLTSNKAEAKMVYRHSGYPGGIKSTTYAKLLDEKPAEAVRRTVRGMLPKNRLGRQMLRKLKVYAGPDHPHAAQQPEPIEFAAARARS